MIGQTWVWISTAAADRVVGVRFYRLLSSGADGEVGESMTVVDLDPGVGRDRRSSDPVPERVAEELGARIMAAAGDVARQESVFLELVGEFDAVGAVAWWAGIRSTAHWLSWACSIAAGTAREHVRVARALRRMPATREAFALGELTYSKVREITRVVDELLRTGPTGQTERTAVPKRRDRRLNRNLLAKTLLQICPTSRGRRVPGSGLEDLNEEGLLELARACTASQLARTIGGWRAARGTSRARRLRQRVTWVIQDDGSVHLTAVLPPEEGAALIAAVQAATDANTDPEPTPGQEIAEDQVSELAREERVQRTRVEALTEIAHH